MSNCLMNNPGRGAGERGRTEAHWFLDEAGT